METAALDEMIARAVEEWRVPGLAVAIIRGDAALHMRGYGVRRLGDPAPVDERTIFAIASCTKAFTAAMIAMLTDEERVRLDDPVIAYLPDFQLADPYVTREITLRDLLCHRSGLATFSGDVLWYRTSYSRDEILRRVRYLRPGSSFRSSFGYQNLMYLAAGKIVEVVAGMSWEQFASERIFAPLSMEDSTTSITAFRPDDPLATPHIERDGAVGPIAYLNVDNETPGGGINSTVRDLTRWLLLQLGHGALEGRRLFSERMAREMWAPQTIIALDESTERLYPMTHFRAYGLGWFLSDYYGRKVIEHDGGLPGMTARVGLVPEERLGYAILSNSETAIVRVVRNLIIDMAIGAPPRDWSAELLAEARAQQRQREADAQACFGTRAEGTRLSLALERYAGRYGGQLYGDVAVELDGDRLVLRMLPAPDLVGALEHWHYDTFRVSWSDTYLPAGLATFVLDARGAPAELRIDVPNPDFNFRELELRRVG